jgi:hypothetical protein
MQINVNVTSLAVILWLGMLIISGSIWVLSSQVRKVADLMEEHSRRTVPDAGLSQAARATTTVRVPRSGPRGRLPVSTRRVIRTGSAWSRN